MSFQIYSSNMLPKKDIIDHSIQTWEFSDESVEPLTRRIYILLLTTCGCVEMLAHIICNNIVTHYTINIHVKVNYY